MAAPPTQILKAMARGRDRSRDGAAIHACKGERRMPQVDKDAGTDFDGKHDRADRGDAGCHTQCKPDMAIQLPRKPDRQMSPDGNRQANKGQIACELVPYAVHALLHSVGASNADPATNRFCFA
jgi:hypothetical protein